MEKQERLVTSIFNFFRSVFKGLPPGGYQFFNKTLVVWLKVLVKNDVILNERERRERERGRGEERERERERERELCSLLKVKYNISIKANTCC